MKKFLVILLSVILLSETVCAKTNDLTDRQIRVADKVAESSQT